jgi:hypothetical protein
VFSIGYKQVATTIMDRVNMKHKVRIMFNQKIKIQLEYPSNLNASEKDHVVGQTEDPTPCMQNLQSNLQYKP